MAHGTRARKREQLSQLISVVAEVLDVARHFPGLIQPGDCLAVVAVPLD